MYREELSRVSDLNIFEGFKESENYYNSFSKEERKSMLIYFLELNEKEQDDELPEEDQIFLGSVDDDLLIDFFSKEDFYSDVVCGFISKPDFKHIMGYPSNFFKKVFPKTATVFIEMFKNASSPQLLANSLDLEFSEKEKEEIITLMNSSKMYFTDYHSKIKFLNKIGIYNGYLDFIFDQETSEEEFLFFVNNIQKEDKDKIVRTVIKNFFMSPIKSMNNESFRTDLFIRFVRDNKEIYQEVKGIYDRREFPFNITLNMMQRNIDAIFEKIDTALNIENF